MKKLLLCLVIFIGLSTITGCSKNNESRKENELCKSIVISNVDEDTRWKTISKYDITLEFENDKCVS